jgi:hypothetical protein
MLHGLERIYGVAKRRKMRLGFQPPALKGARAVRPCSHYSKRYCVFVRKFHQKSCIVSVHIEESPDNPADQPAYAK